MRQPGSRIRRHSSGFQTALQLVSVGINLAIELGFRPLIIHPIQSHKRVTEDLRFTVDFMGAS
jgi:hypothetical protein